MLHVIGAGLPRTGTRSMKAALERLGFGPCYHMAEIGSNPDHVDRWLPAASGLPLDWDSVLDGYRSTQDWPASFFWREQAELYPDAKVILTVRDPHRWYVSMQTLIATRRDVPPDLPEAAAALLRTMERLLPVLDRIGESIFGDTWDFQRGMPDEEIATAAYHRYVAVVQKSLPADRLLVFDVREGWEPLCRFLGVNAPAGEPFPHLNDSETMRRALQQLLTDGSIDSAFISGTHD
ncbi:sulfotransferase family protein [Nonomuraea guangzhouensis]|uniref:Sulfotransferase family protein n=1 Tax=Nonomuraea guangzhouensis TaxID=1291555 RepID=A0ABW4GGP0_9ACTN|nr:sulfotransferase family protein [Nonomuraea guangzhouensis]